MRKFTLVTLVGMALALYLYGIVKNFTYEQPKEVDHIKDTTIAVYME